MAQTIRGNGLHEAHNALWSLSQNPERLNLERKRFDSPPTDTDRPVRSRSLSTTEPPTPASEGEVRRSDREQEIARQCESSRPGQQFIQQVCEEVGRFKEERGEVEWARMGQLQIEKAAAVTIQNCWIEQGIWRPSWKRDGPKNAWQHEVLTDSDLVEPESAAGTEAAEKITFESKPKRPKSDQEFRRTADRRAAHLRQPELTRPIHQFLRQVSVERETMQCQYGPSAPDTPNLLETINTRAYEKVKKLWEKRHLWDDDWGVLPGMRWKHEYSEAFVSRVLAKEFGSGPARDVAQTGAGLSPLPRLFGTQLPPEPNPALLPGSSTATPKGPPPSSPPTGLQNSGSGSLPAASTGTSWKQAFTEKSLDPILPTEALPYPAPNQPLPANFRFGGEFSQEPSSAVPQPRSPERLQKQVTSPTLRPAGFPAMRDGLSAAAADRNSTDQSEKVVKFADQQQLETSETRASHPATEAPSETAATTASTSVTPRRSSRRRQTCPEPSSGAMATVSVLPPPAEAGMDPESMGSMRRKRRGGGGATAAVTAVGDPGSNNTPKKSKRTAASPQTQASATPPAARRQTPKAGTKNAKKSTARMTKPRVGPTHEATSPGPGPSTVHGEDADGDGATIMARKRTRVSASAAPAVPLPAPKRRRR